MEVDVLNVVGTLLVLSVWKDACGGIFRPDGLECEDFDLVYYSVLGKCIDTIVKTFLVSTTASECESKGIWSDSMI